jgi:hypothetical protein
MWGGFNWLTKETRGGLLCYEILKKKKRKKKK